MGYSRARKLEWVAILSPGDHPDLGIEPGSPTLQADSLPSELPGKPLRMDKKNAYDYFQQLQPQGK